MAQVKLENITKSYDKVQVVKHINLDIKDREFIVLVGPSGCGKSTVLRMIAGLESITSGQIVIGERVVNDVSPKDRDIAMVFQSYALYPHMSVYDNMAFGLKMRKFPKDEIKKRVEDAAKILDLAHLLDRKPKQLSGGQRQRVALGRAIVRNPQVFLMDEPLSNLDAKLRVQMRTEIQKLHRNLNATTIYVTHDQIEAMTMGDRIVILHEGIIQQVGEPAHIYANPVNTFVGGFIGSMYFLNARYENNQLRFESGEAWALPESIAAQLNEQGYPGKPVQIGIRPEHFSPPQAGTQRQTVTVKPDIVEVLGYEHMVHFTMQGHNIVASLPADFDVKEGQPVELGIDLNRVSYFDADSGLNILCKAEPVLASSTV